MLELGDDAEPADDGCEGYCISSFMGLQDVVVLLLLLLLLLLLPYKSDEATPTEEGENSLIFVNDEGDCVEDVVEVAEAAKDAVA